MFGKNNKKSHDNDCVLWAVFIIIAIAVSFFVVMEISREKPEVFSADPSGVTAATKGAIQEPLDVSVMIAPAD